MEIEIKKKADFPHAVFEVIVKGDNTTTHEVILEAAYYKRLTGGKISPEDLLKNSLEFLLSRESNTSILRKFNLRKINDYFPEFESTLKLIT